MPGVFVTGTDTNVGKTVVSAAIMHRYRSQRDLCYWKPIQTGIEQDNDTATVGSLGECRDVEIHDVGVRLLRPLSPHLSAQLAGKQIVIRDVLRMKPNDDGTRTCVVEGAGGVLVPLNDSELMIDLIAALDLPIIIAARSGLGTINHTLMTLETLRQRELVVAGVVMVGAPNSENRVAIERYGEIPVLGEMPHFEELTAAVLKRWAINELDRDHLLEAQFDG